LASTKIDIKKLKHFAYCSVPGSRPLYQIMLLEEDTMEIEVFLSRLPLWLKLIRMQDIRSG